MNTNLKTGIKRKGASAAAKTMADKKAPSFAEAGEQLKREIRMYQESYREADGKIRDSDCLRTIACLRVALRLCVKKLNL